VWVADSASLGDGAGHGAGLHALLAGPDREVLDGVPLLCLSSKLDVLPPSMLTSSSDDDDENVDPATTEEETHDKESSDRKKTKKPPAAEEEWSIAAEKRLGLHVLPRRCWRLARVSALSGEGLSAAFGWLEGFLTDPLRQSQAWFGGEIERLRTDIVTLQRAVAGADAVTARKTAAAAKNEKASVAGRMATLDEQLQSARSYYGKKMRAVDDQRRIEKAKASRLEARCQALEGRLEEKERGNADLRSTVEGLQRALAAAQDREDAAIMALEESGGGGDEIGAAWLRVNSRGGASASSVGDENAPPHHGGSPQELGAVREANDRRSRGDGARRRKKPPLQGMSGMSARTARDLELAAEFRQRHAMSGAAVGAAMQQPAWTSELQQQPVPQQAWSAGVGDMGGSGFGAVLGNAAVSEAMWRAERGQRRQAQRAQVVDAQELAHERLADARAVVW
jgi:hypothetical protein